MCCLLFIGPNTLVYHCCIASHSRGSVRRSIRAQRQAGACNIIYTTMCECVNGCMFEWMYLRNMQSLAQCLQFAVYELRVVRHVEDGGDQSYQRIDAWIVPRSARACLCSLSACLLTSCATGAIVNSRHSRPCSRLYMLV